MKETVKKAEEQVNFGSFLPTMAICSWRKKRWDYVHLVDTKEYKIYLHSPASRFGVGVIEGFKLYLDEDGNPVIFRIGDHFRRFQKSAKRLAMPRLNWKSFITAIQELTKLYAYDLKKGEALYFAPVFANISDPHDSMKAFVRAEYVLAIGVCYLKPKDDTFKIEINTTHSRGVKGGTSNVKFVGNYAPSALPQKIAESHDCNSFVYTDSIEHKYLEECPTSNFFAVIDGEVWTPSNRDGTFLDGVTRDSVMAICRYGNIKLNCKKMPVADFVLALEEHRVQEAWITGTAVDMGKIVMFYHKGKKYRLPEVPKEKSIYNKVKNILILAHTREAFSFWTKEVEKLTYLSADLC